MILSMQTLRELKPITPFFNRTEVDIDGIRFSYGLGPAGYDVRIGETVVVIPMYTTLASTIEQFEMPNNCMAIVHDKSTWARLGLAVQNTVIEPGWKGYLTLELTYNPTYPNEEKLYIKENTPIAQIVFHQIDAVSERLYDGKYQNQPKGPQPAR